MGTRWEYGGMVTCEDKAQEDKEAGRTKEEVTMTAWGQMASSIVPGLKFKVDFPINNTNLKVPMLDFQLWCEEEEDPDRPGHTRQSLRYQFYEKPMTNPKVLDMGSAMPQEGEGDSATVVES